MTVVVASEPPRLCKPGEWSDNAATRFTVLYHPFCLSPLYPLARALAPFRTICNFPATLRLPFSLVLTAGLSFHLSFHAANLFISCMRPPLHSDGYILGSKSSRSDYHRQTRGSKHCRRNSYNDTNFIMKRDKVYKFIFNYPFENLVVKFLSPT